MFKINDGKGFFIEFPNKYGLSVQFGYGNYCSNRDYDFAIPSTTKSYQQRQRELGQEGSESAEIAVFAPDGKLVGQDLGIFEGDQVEGWCSPIRVLEVLNLVAALPTVKTKSQLITEIAKEQDIPVEEIKLSKQADFSDLLGFPSIVKKP